MEFLRRLGPIIWTHLRALKPSFISKDPHFNFISAHYFWIIGMSIFASILLYSTANGQLPYVDALFFASGANTQAGLNTIDLNQLNTFQQIVMYIFPMVSCPITLHGSVVFLRLYWFEKRLQNHVRDARSRRGTLSRSKSRGGDASRLEKGVNGRKITILRESGKRMANDGSLLGPKEPIISAPAAPSTHQSTNPSSTPSSNGSDRDSDGTVGGDHNTHLNGLVRPAGQPHSISFAPTVIRSDGIELDATKFPESSTSDDDGTVALERQEHTKDSEAEVLRIPNPRDADRGIGPTRLEVGESRPEDDDDDDDDQGTGDAPESHKTQSAPQSPSSNRAQDRQELSDSLRQRAPVIQILEPDPELDERRQQERTVMDTVMDNIADEARAIGNTFGPLRFRKPRLFQSKDKVHHVDSDESDNSRSSAKGTMRKIKSLFGSKEADEAPYLSWTPTTGRNSQFPGLTLEQREELGGIEYRSLRTLALLLAKQQYGEVVDAAGVSRTWWSFYTSNSAFMDLGLTLTPDSMISFQRSTFVMMIFWLLIIAGNTGFPVFLRFMIWATSRVVPRDLVFFLILDLNNPIVQDLPWNVRIADGLFQAAATRTAGFSCFPINFLHPGVQTLYLIMMYISVFPIAISIRGTNVYEERSLGIYSGHDEDDGWGQNAMNYIGTHLRRQLSFDLWFVFLALFILAISEGGKLERKEFNMFDVLFEVVSAYGTVGLSMGYHTVDASLCSQFSTVGKLVIIAAQVRGRHRGLPYGLDRAILLPSESRFAKEAAEPVPGLPRTNTAVSTTSAPGLARRITTSTRPRTIERPSTNFLPRFCIRARPSRPGSIGECLSRRCKYRINLNSTALRCEELRPWLCRMRKRIRNSFTPCLGRERTEGRALDYGVLPLEPDRTMFPKPCGQSQ
ncbi:unnamed protein product [Parascedosporium putredinis]|uniref:Potassium transport protein n=1 Tax=Parascedosporium putredinis TaxID=1442378 RepID=A0A9P1MEJ6_9PEZI|nr:unnamed protein product [Parascedosporium putredinis]CAI8000673.1 unnamed protein product [Parascedosporium putredinis]